MKNFCNNNNKLSIDSINYINFRNNEKLLYNHQNKANVIYFLNLYNKNIKLKDELEKYSWRLCNGIWFSNDIRL